MRGLTGFFTHQISEAIIGVFYTSNIGGNNRRKKKGKRERKTQEDEGEEEGEEKEKEKEPWEG